MTFPPPAPGDIDASCEHLRTRFSQIPDVAVILGSGLGGVSGILSDTVRIPYHSVPHFPHVSVPGHAGAFLCGYTQGQSILLMLGRPHYYESGSLDDVLFPVRLLYRLGVRILIITNAAGSLRDDLVPGDVMAIEDQIDLTFLPRSPAQGTVSGLIYDRDLLRDLADAASSAGLSLRHGVYCGVRGPAYETRSETGMLKFTGGDAVGMSTVHEARLAAGLGMRVAGISVITNMADGGQAGMGHDDVILRSGESSRTLGRLITGLLRRRNR